MDFAQSLSVMGGLLTSPLFWVALIAALLISGPIGLIPGIGGTSTIALLLPFLILNVDPTIGLIFIGGMIALGQSVDIIPAVLLGYPGPSTTVDFLEGHQLARRGYGAQVVGASYIVSALGGLFGAACLLIVLPFIRPVIVNFSFAEIAAMAIVGLAMVVLVATGSLLRGFASAILGLLLGTIGPSVISPQERFTFDQLYLLSGLPLIPVLLGLFALPEVIDLAMHRKPIAPPGNVSYRQIWEGVGEGLKRWKVIPRQSLFGVFMGAIPGVGSATVEWLSYALGITFSKDKSQFGKGSLDGVLFTESAQASKEAGQAIPTLAFGIPGGHGWAMMLVGLIAYDIAPGLGMLGQHLDVTLGLVLTIAIGNVLSMFVALALGGQVAKLTLIPYSFIAGMLLPLAFISAFQANFNLGDIYVLLGIAALGLAMKWFGWPRVPFLLAFILAPVVESNLFAAVSIGGPLTFVTRPWALTILILAVAFTTYLTLVTRRSAKEMSQATGRLLQESDGAPPAVPQGGSGDEPVKAAAFRTLRSLTFNRQWSWEYAFWGVLLTWVIGVVLRETLGFDDIESRFFPLNGAVAFLAVMGLLIAMTFIRPKAQGQIFDIGMRSGTDSAAVRSLGVMLLWILAFFVAMATVGLQFAAVFFPLVYINTNMPWRGRKRLWSLIPSGFLAFVVFGMLDNVMHVIWPDRFILNWFL